MLHIDCTTCPGRHKACAGCMMNVLFTGPNCENAPRDGVVTEVAAPADPDAEILAAIDVFAASAMASSSAARSARSGIRTGQNTAGRLGPRALRVS